MMEHLTVSLDLHGHACLVVGGGLVARDKAQALLRVGGRVTVVAPRVCADLRALSEAAKVHWHRRRYRLADLDEPTIAFAATDDARVNEAVATDAKARRIPVNVADRPELSSFILPTVTDHSPTGVAAETSGMAPAPRGEIYLVGAGPGAPDLLTFRAAHLMQQADVVIFDRLVPDAILDLVRHDAERIYAGKAAGNHVIAQSDINALLVRLAKAGKRVLRLKGGDPFIFGRGGEEIDCLAAQGIPFEVVPGVTAAAGCAAYAGIPLTHRDFAQSCLFVTGHQRDGSVELDWAALARPNQTVVIYMGLGGLETICAHLLEHGVRTSMPAAVIARGTTPDQRVVSGTLLTLPTLVAEAALDSPALIVVGEVVRLRQRLRWF